MTSIVTLNNGQTVTIKKLASNQWFAKMPCGQAFDGTEQELIDMAHQYNAPAQPSIIDAVQSVLGGRKQFASHLRIDLDREQTIEFPDRIEVIEIEIRDGQHFVICRTNIHSIRKEKAIDSAKEAFDFINSHKVA